MESYRTEPLPEPVAPEQRRTSYLRIALDILETLVMSVLLFIVINAISARIRVDGYSMEPTLESGEFVIVNKLAYKLGSPELGDVVVFHYPRDPEQEYIKRVIGVPGDRVRIAGGKVYVNDQLIKEPYIAAAPAYQSDQVVPENTLFVLGDNRNNSSDSHNWGPVPMKNIVGKALFVYWPPARWGIISHIAGASTPP